MAGVRRILLYFLLFSIVCLQQTTGKYRGGSSSHSSRPSYSRPSYSKPSYSKPSYSKPSYPSSSGLSGSSSGSRYPSSSNSWGSRPSYPSSSGLSGSGLAKPSYPSSNGLSGSGSLRPSYPSSSGLSGSGSSRSPSYPNSNGLSGSGSSKPSYPSSGGLSGSGSSRYPGSNGLSGSGSSRPSYPSSNGLSGNSRQTTSRPYYYPTTSKPYYPPSTSSWFNNHGSYDNTHHTTGFTLKPLPQGVYYWDKHTTTTRRPYVSQATWSNNNNKPTTTVHHHHHHHHYDTNHYHGGYHYSPPAQVIYTPSYGTSYNYPVYSGELPTYVYQYRNSGNKFSKLLTGLALYNLGVSHANPQMHNYYKHYTPEAGEKCTFGMKNPNYNQYSFDSYEYEEVRVDCRLISSFLWQEYHEKPKVTNTTTIVTNTTTTVITSKVPQSNQILHPNGTIITVPNNTTVLPNKTAPISQNIYPNGTLLAANKNPLTSVELKPVNNVTINATIPTLAGSANFTAIRTSIENANRTTVNTLNNTVANVSTIMNNKNNTEMKSNVTTVLNANGTISTNNLTQNITQPNILSNGIIQARSVGSNVAGTIKADNLVKPPFESLSQTILPNGTLVEETISKTTTKTSNVLVTHLTDSRLNGIPVILDKKEECYVTRTTPTSKMRRSVDCGLLQTYSEKSLKKSSAKKISPTSAMLVLIATTLFLVH